MSHTTTIQSATFAGTTLASVLLVRIARRAAIKQQAGDTDAFVTSVQPAATQIATTQYPCIGFNSHKRACLTD